LKQESTLGFEAILGQYAAGALSPDEARSLLNATRSSAGMSSATAPRPTPPPGSDAIAVIGMSGEFPGAVDIAGFRRNLAAGRVTVGPLSEPYLRGAANPYRWGGVLGERDMFDPGFFGIPAFEAHSMSPHQRLALRECWRAIENGGTDPRSLAGKSVGIFVGAEPTGYVHETLSGSSDAVIAGRISYLLNLRGPALVVNTACSSSLVAIHLACESLRSGECGFAVAGGVYADLNQRTLAALGQSGMLSPDGACRTFDAGANGTVFSEGVAMFALKRLDDALADGDPVHGLIRASGVNHDGASNGLTAPSGDAQEQLILDTYRRFGVDPERIGYVEAHGTATKLGDPVEANALARSFGRLTDRRGYCRVGSAKAFIGHTGAASGAIGVVKALLGLKRGRFFGMPPWRSLNPMIRLEESAFRIDDNAAPWPAEPGRARMAAVTSLGISGTNAHVVVEEFAPAEAAAEEADEAAAGQGSGPVIVPLSAADPERLRAAASRLAEALSGAEDDEASEDGTPPGPDRQVAGAAEAGDPLHLGDLQRMVADLLGVAADTIDPDERLDFYGFEPEQLIALGAALEDRLRHAVDLRSETTNTTVAQLHRRIGSQVGQPTAPAPESAAASGGDAVSLKRIAHTLQVGRPEMPERVAFVAESAPALEAALRAFAAQEPVVEGCFTGRADGDNRFAQLFDHGGELQDLLGGWLDRGDLARVAEAWTLGVSVPWPKATCRRTWLPGYPFAQERYGKDDASAEAPAAEAGPAAVTDATSTAVAPGLEHESETTAVPMPAGASGPSVRPDDAVVQEAPSEAGQPAPDDAPDPSDAAEDVLAATNAWLASLVADTVGTPADAIDPQRGLDEYGVDSIARTRVNHILANAFPEASHTLLFEFSSIASLAAFLVESYPGECRSAAAGSGFLETARRTDAPAPASSPSPTSGQDLGVAAPAAPRLARPAPAGRERDDDPTADGIAIVGVSARFPQARTVAELWELLRSGRTAIGEIPPERWDWREHYDPAPSAAERFRKSHSKWGAFLNGAYEFDPAFFGLMPVEARNIDPQERLFLQECWKALEDAGFARGKLPDDVRRTAGIFAGASKHGFELTGTAQGLELPRTSFGALVNRVSFQLDFGGPSEATNTACSSALVALHRACDAIRSGQCGLALVGGVNLYLHPSTYVELTATRMLSTGPECAAFGRDADGIVPGEGVAVVVLKPLRRALADGDHVYATVLGSAVNHNGRTSGFTVPNPQRQADAIRTALRRAGVDPRTISYVESSVNGTEIGDAVEMTGLTEVFAGRAGVEGRYGVGSVKPNLGHGEAVSGMAQLLKVVLALRHRWLPPTLAPREINPAIDFARVPFDLQVRGSDWEPVVVDGAPAPLRAGITSIGAGGVNAHVVIEEAPTGRVPESPGANPAASLFVLSARTPEQLRDYVAAWLVFLDETPDLDPARAAYTVQVGREDMRHRLAVIAADRAGLRDRLSRWLDGRPDVGSTFAGEAADRRPADPAAAGGASAAALPGVARAWVAGGEVAWDAFYDATPRPTRLPGLPAYPFERRVCGPDGAAAPAGGGGASGSTRALLEDVLAGLLGVTPAEVARRTFEELGLNSVNAVAFVDSINAAFGTDFPTSLAFEFADTRSLAEYVATRAGARPPRDAGPAPQVRADRRENRERDDVAIVGLACRAAGAADAQSFWRIVRDGRDALDEVSDPQTLAFVREHQPDALPPRYGAIPGSDCFDSAFFKISPHEAAEMNPAQRVLLEECYHALEDAGYDPTSLRGASVATIIGTNALPPQSDYTAHALLGSDCSVLAARLAYFLDLRGPAMAIDTACSSSLVAIDTARRMVQDGEADLALAGGVTVYTHPGIFVAMDSLGIVSPSRVCRPFDSEADGMLLGEGVGVLVLKRLSDARRDGDSIYGIIRGSATNQDGRTSGITAPSYLAQSELVRTVLDSSGIDVERLGYLETHGTGTKLGDPIEIHALGDAFGALTSKRGFCAIGSIKANVGHTTAAAGVLGTIKLLLSMRHGALPPAANFETPNPHIDFADSPVFVNTRLRDWPVDEAGRRFGAVSSFGYSGTNAHIVIEQPADPRPAQPRPAAAGPQLVPLSAASEAQLRNKADALRTALRDRGLADADLPDIAHVLQTGREAMRHRAVVTAGTLAELDDGLAAIAEGREPAPGVIRGVAADGPAPDDGREDGDGLARTWCAGAAVAWDRLHEGRAPRRLGLPGHPFEKRRFATAWRFRADEPHDDDASPALPADASAGADRREDAPSSSLAVVEAAGTRWWQSRPDLLEPATIDRAGELNRELNQVTRDLLLATLRAEGLFKAAGERYTAEALTHRLGVLDMHDRLFAAMLDMLVDSGFARRDGDGLVVTEAAASAAGLDGTADRDAHVAALARRYPEIESFLPFLRNCVEATPALLAGRKRAHEVLFPGGSFEALADVYSGNESANELLADLVVTLARRRLEADPAARFSVVEIGAGTGSASRHVLPALKPYADRVDYVYTDISKSFAQFGARRFAEDYPFAAFRTLDVERPPQSQDFTLGTFDVVLASNVLHATTRMAATLTHSAELLRPGGVLIMLEATEVRDYFTLTFGLTSGWWAYEDERLENSPLLSIPLWRRALQAAGFGATKAWPLLGGTETRAPEAVIVAEVAAADGESVPDGERAAAAGAPPPPPPATPEPATPEPATPEPAMPEPARLEPAMPEAAMPEPAVAPAPAPATPDPAPLPSGGNGKAPEGGDVWDSGFERLVADAWRDVLGQDTIRPGDDFLDLGGDSILALQVASRLKQSFPFSLELSSLFEARKVRDMAEMLEAEVIERIDELPEDAVSSLLGQAE